MRAVLTYIVAENGKPEEKTKLFDTDKSTKICDIRNFYEITMQELYISKTGILFKYNIEDETLEVADQKKCKEWIGRNYPDRYIEFFENQRRHNMAVSKEIKETIAVTIDEVFKKMNSISWLERQKAMKDEAFKNTEKILYCFNILKEHIADEKEYLEMVHKNKSTSIVRYSKNKPDKPEEDQLLKDRTASYNRSRTDVERIEKALARIKGKKGCEVIEYRYLKRKDNGSVYTFTEIAELLAGRYGYNNNLNEKTVRGYKNELVRDIAVFLLVLMRCDMFPAPAAGRQGLDKTPVLPPLTCLFNYVRIITISKVRIKTVRFSCIQEAALFFLCCFIYCTDGGAVMAFVKYCSAAGCSRLVPLGVKYCKAHTAARAAGDKERHKKYDMYKRNQEAKAFYNSTEWQYTRAAVLARDNHIDIYLYIMEGRAVPASTVHHIAELSEDYSKRCDMDNLVSVSEATHSMIGKVYNDARRKKHMQDTLKECVKEYKKRLALAGV